MKKLITKLTVCAVLVFTACICTGEDSVSSGQAGTTQLEQAAVVPASNQKVELVAADAGRGDPFGSSFGESSPPPPPVNIAPAVNLKVQEVNKPPLIVRTVSLKFLDAVNLKAAVDKMSSADGSVSVNESTNSMIVCDTEENVKKILVEIQKADITPKQIMIEAVIIDIQLQHDSDIGVDWDILSSDNKGFNYRQSTIYPDRLSVIPPTTGTIGSRTAYQNIGLGTEVAIVADDIRNVLHLLQQKTNMEIIASPRVLVVSGQKAEIKTVEELPYQEMTDTSQGGQMTSTQFKEVGVTMEVKASVTDEGKILLTVSPSQSINTGESLSGVPIVDTRKASTTLLMDDGQVVAMGGLRRQGTQIAKSQVPLLGDLPLIGFIFSSTKKTTVNAELLVLLSPHIYKNEPVPAEAVARFDEIRKRPVLSLPAEPNMK